LEEVLYIAYMASYYYAKRLNLKSAVAFKDSDQPELVVLVPKRYVSSAGGGCILPRELWVSVYLERGAPTLALDIDASTVLNLRNPLKKNSDAAMMNRFAIDEIRMLPKGRRADLLLVSEEVW